LSNAYPSFRLTGSAKAKLLVGASLLRFAITRHFCTASKALRSEQNENVSETALRKATLTPYQPPQIKAELASAIDQVPWSYTLGVANQYVLSVMCGTVAQYDLLARCA
jgi:hypothetical protein